MRAGAVHRLGLITLALAFAPLVALAQDAAAIPDAALEAYASASPAENPMDEPAAAPDEMLSPEDAAALANALAVDSADTWTAAPARPLRLPSLSSAKGLDVSRADRPDGSATVVLKQPLPTEWDAKVGADLGLAATPSEVYQPGQPMPGLRESGGSGAAWASLGVLPNLATLDARVDPGNDQGRLGTTFRRSMPLGSRFSVTLQNSASITETFSALSASVAGLPTMTTPNLTALPTPEVWDNEMAAKFDIVPTGTAFGAKVASNSTDPATHNTLSAEQRLYGPLHVTTAVTDLGQPTSSKSITAGFKLNW
jgi:hypothetical protein